MATQTHSSIEYVTGTAARAERRDGACLRLVRPGDVYVDGRLICENPRFHQQGQEADMRAQGVSGTQVGKRESSRLAGTDGARRRQRYDWRSDLKPWQGEALEERVAFERQATRTLGVVMAALFVSFALAIVIPPLL